MNSLYFILPCQPCAPFSELCQWAERKSETEWIFLNINKYIIQVPVVPDLLPARPVPSLHPAAGHPDPTPAVSSSLNPASNPSTSLQDQSSTLLRDAAQQNQRGHRCYTGTWRWGTRAIIRVVRPMFRHFCTGKNNFAKTVNWLFWKLFQFSICVFILFVACLEQLQTLGRDARWGRGSELPKFYPVFLSPSDILSDQRIRIRTHFSLYVLIRSECMKEVK